MDPHWRHQYYQTFQNSVRYDFIGKFEYFDRQFAEVLSNISADYQMYLSEERRHSQDTSGLLHEYYNERLRKQVYACFRKDFSCFDYAKTLPDTA